MIMNITEAKLEEIKEYLKIEGHDMKYHKLLDEMVKKVTATHHRDIGFDKRQTLPLPIKPRFNLESILKNYNKRLHLFSKKHILMRLDSHPYLNVCDIQNPNLAMFLKTAESLFHKALEERGIRYCDLKHELAEEIYRGSEELKREYQKMYEALKDSKVQDYIELSHALGTELWYFHDVYSSAPLWAEIESQVKLQMHNLTFKEKLKVFHSFTTRFPKKGSFEFRSRLEENLLKSDFTTLSLSEVLMFKVATKKCQKSDLVFEKFILDLMLKKREMTVIESSVGLDIAYTYFFHRKRPMQTNEQDKEEQQVMDWVYKPIQSRVGLMSDSDLLRLVRIRSLTRKNKYPELETMATRDILSRLKDIDPDVLLELLFSLTRINYNTGVGDKLFWDKICVYLLTNFGKFDALNDPLLFCEMFELLAYHQKLTPKNYKIFFQVKILNWLENIDLSIFHIVPLFNGIMYMELAYPNTNKFHEDIKSIVTNDSYQHTTPRPKHLPTLKLMLMYARANDFSGNLQILDSLLSQADWKFSPSNSESMKKTIERKDVVNFAQTKFDADMLPVFNHQNAFCIDLVNETSKLAIFLKTPADVLSSSVLPKNQNISQGRFLPERQLQMAVLRAQGWHVYELNYLKYINLGKDKDQYLLNILKNETQKSKTNIKRQIKYKQPK